MRIIPSALLLLLILFGNKTKAQKNSDKIDSVFKFYFFIFNMETTDCCPFIQYSSYYDTIVLKNGKDTVYLNKYVVDAAVFIQKISGIKTPGNSYHSSNRAVTPDMIKKWEAWYRENRHQLRWSHKWNRPVVRE